MEFSFPRYLAAKRTVDDRALNRAVWEGMAQALGDLQTEGVPEILEVGAGTGTMARRMVEWGALRRGRYTALDAREDNLAAARELLPAWAQDAGLGLERGRPGEFHLIGPRCDLWIEWVRGDVFDFIRQAGARWDLLAAHAFLDLFDVPGLIPGLAGLVRPGGYLYLTINFDGETIFEPVWDPALEERIIRAYHRTMDERRSAGQPSGDSRAGRHLFGILETNGLEVRCAGASDWVVFPIGKKYPADEAYFLHSILHFFEESLGSQVEVEPGELAGWLARRRAQIERGELVYIAHQLDFFVRKPI